MTKSAVEKKKYPIGAEHYELYEEIGQGVSAVVRRALCVPFNEVVAIKILDFERDNSDLNKICREAQTMVLVDHPNVLKAHCSFVSDHNLWVVTPYMAGGSCLHMLKAAHPDGFEEVTIATILRDVLRGLDYLHSEGHIHRDVKAGNILLDSTGAVKLGDFGVSACLFDSGDRQVKRNTFVGTPCWMAPEVMEQLHGYDFKADIWSFGITALELAHGHAPFSKFPPLKVLLMTLQNAPPGLDYERDKKFSKSFKDMIASCLVKDPSKRPAAKKLLKHSFFKQAKSKELIARKLLDGLPTLGDRIKALKRKEEDMLAQKEIPDVQMEEISQNEYKRGISGWNFNLDDMKAQASMINDVDHSESDNNIGGSSDSLVAQDVDGTQLKCPSSSDMDGDMMHKPPSVKLAAHISKCYKSDDDSSATDYVSQTSSPSNGAYSESNLDVKPNLEARKRSMEDLSNSTKQGGEASHGTVLPEVNIPSNRMDSDKGQKLQQSSPSYSGAAVLQTVNDVPPEMPPQSSNSSVNSDDLEEKPKVPVVQQRGRFKVTSENADMQKVTPHPVLQKSLSMQVINQHHATSLASLPSPSEATSSTVTSSSLFSVLHSALHDNIVQRENILYLMKLLSTAESAGPHVADGTQVAAIEKSALEAAHEKEKDMLNELSELQWRLICAQEELQKYKKEDVQFSSS